jgi:hypothetical protein
MEEKHPVAWTSVTNYLETAAEGNLSHGFISASMYEFHQMLDAKRIDQRHHLRLP